MLPRRLRRWWALALTLATAAVVVPTALLASAQSQSVRVVAATGGQVQVVTLHVDGRDRSYRLFVPSGLQDRAHTLLLAVHWLNGTAARFEANYGLDRGALANNAVIAYPDGLGRSWDAGTCCGYAVRHRVDDLHFLLRVVADVEHRVHIDPSHVAVTGFSNGALMSYRLICTRPDVFHVAVAVAGDLVAPACQPSLPVSLLHVHGVRDRVIPIAGVRSSPIDRTGFPPAADSVDHIADVDRCAGATTTSSGLTTTWAAYGCASGAQVRFITSQTLPHRYPTGPTAISTYGVDMPPLTWSFLRTAWPS